MKKGTFEQEKPKITDIGSQLEESLLGLEKAEKTILVILENLEAETHSEIRIYNYVSALYLAHDRILDESERISKSVCELYKLKKTQNEEAAE